MRQVNRRKRPLVKKSSIKMLGLSAGLGMVAALVVYSLQSGLADLASHKVENTALEASRASGFQIEEVFVEGRLNTPLEDLRAVVGLKRSMPILAADPAYLRQRIEALPWVAGAVVERRLPNEIHIRLNEHRPVAMWQHDGTFSLINRAGEVILTGGHDINVFAHLPQIVGKGAPEKALDVLALIQTQSDLSGRVKAAVRVSQRRWDIVMDTDTTIRLPENDPTQAWATFAKYERSHKLLEKGLSAIDLRLDDKILVKLGDPERLSKPLSGQDT